MARRLLMSASSGDPGLYDRRVLRRAAPPAEVLRPRLRDGHDVLVPYAQLARDVDPRLVAEAPARPQEGGVAADEVRPLVAVHPDAVAHAVGEVPVAGAEAGLLDHLACRGVHGLRLDPRPGRAEGRLLRPPHDVPDPALPLRGRRAKDGGAGDVAGVAVEAAAAVDEDDVACAERLGLRGAVRGR